jgi:hypothetical protein
VEVAQPVGVIMVKVGQDEDLEVFAGVDPQGLQPLPDLVAGLDVDVDGELEERVPPGEPAVAALRALSPLSSRIRPSSCSIR